MKTLTIGGFEYEISDNRPTLARNVNEYCINELHEIHEASHYCDEDCSLITATNDPELIKQGIPELTSAESKGLTEGKENGLPIHISYMDGIHTYCGLIVNSAISHHRGQPFTSMVKDQSIFCSDCLNTYNTVNKKLIERNATSPAESTNEEPCDNCHCANGHSVDCTIPASNDVKAVEVEPSEACSGDVEKAAKSWFDSQDNYTKYDVFKAGAQWQASQQSKSLNEAVDYAKLYENFLTGDNNRTAYEFFKFLSQLKQ